MTGLVYAHSQASGHSMPPNTSDSRQSVLIALSCGCFFFSAIFSGRMWMIRNTPMAAMGAMNSTIQASALATESSVSPLNTDACADGARVSANRVAAAVAGRRWRSRFDAVFLFMNRSARALPWGAAARATSSVHHHGADLELI